MKLNELQRELEGIYDVATPHRVEDFLLHESQVLVKLTQDAFADQCPEKLLVAQNNDGLDVALFLHESVMNTLSSDNPAELLHDGNLQDFFFAVEGVSHFLYLAWNAGFDRAITQLELEIVAEVDKFVTMAARLLEQRGGAVPGLLLKTLFENICFRQNLPELERQRYYEANRLASRYCHSLTRHYALNLTDPALRRELRRFYRMPQELKIRRIESDIPCGF